MTELEKMLAGAPYDCGDPELMKLWNSGKNLMRRYNRLPYDARDEQMRVLDELLGVRGRSTQITAPFYVDYGKFIFLGENCEINMDCVFLDCNRISVGDNVLIGPGVHIYTVFHPVSGQERMKRNQGGGFPFATSQTAPVSIGNDVWIGGRSIIMPGVSIGSNVTVGAGSIVTRSLPDNVLAYGAPCRVMKEI